MAMLIFSSILMVSLSAVLYLIVRALPRVVEEPSMPNEGSATSVWKRSELPEKIDAFLNGFFLKFLRKLKVAILKLDNSLSHHLQRMKPEENAKRNGIDFKEIAGQNKEGENAKL